MEGPKPKPKPKPTLHAEGGRVPLVGGLLGKFSKAEVLIQMLKNTLKGSKDSYVKKNFPNFIKELEANPELANNPNVWGHFTKGLPKNQRLVVHSDDTVDFWTQSDFGPHNIETTNKFMTKHPYFTREQAIKIQNMEPEDQILEMKRLETIRNRTKQATGGRVPMIFGGSTGLRALWARLRGEAKTLFPKFKKDQEGLGRLVDPKTMESIESLNLQQLENMLEALKIDKKALAQIAENKAMKDPGLDFLMGKMKEDKSFGFDFDQLAKYTDIDNDIMIVEQMIKNKTMKDRKLNATGGRVSLSAGGLAGILGE